MDILIFILRYTPFWAIPLAIICLQFAYIFWLKNIKNVAYGMGTVAVFCLFVVIFYYWVGGPEKIGPFFYQLIR